MAGKKDRRFLKFPSIPSTRQGSLFEPVVLLFENSRCGMAQSLLVVALPVSKLIERNQINF
ncbi:hypothetical protein DUE52_10005 [Larkinella punicea]|uniref:Uncharacterized protein n=1 Tax=Larkinella punicea TaxID=2315727 RepID=A0A368JSU6_9BACT|nr:hypothetical protein DUE52_10005 [Larkinella punicea]